MEIIRVFHCGYFDCRGAFLTILDSYCCLKGGTKLKQSITNGYFTFQMTLDITVACPFLSIDVVCMDCRGAFRTVLDS